MLIPVAKPYRVTSKYGIKRNLFGKEHVHLGIDFVSLTGLKDAYAALDGIVIHDKDNYDHSKRWMKGNTAGNFIILKHIVDGVIYYSRYLHLGYNRVSVGDSVHKGMLIGEYGDYGRSTGPHLHFDLSVESWKKIDPTSWFRKLEV